MPILLPTTGLVSFVFHPLTQLSPTIAIFIFATIISFLITLPYKFLLDQKKMKQLREEIKSLSEKMREEQKNGNTEKANELLMRSMKLNNEIMRLTFKPMMLSFLIVIIFIPWIAHQYQNVVIHLPFYFPFVGHVFPFNWIGWYIVSSLTMSKIFRVLLGVEL